MRNSFRLIFSAFAMVGAAQSAAAAIIDFEGFAPPNDLVNVSPTAPYIQDGFTLMPTNSASAVFDSGYTIDSMIGNPSDWFGFGESNQPVLSMTSPTGPFDLLSLLIGPSSIASSNSVNIIITGLLHGGGSLSATFNNLTTATSVTLNWIGLNSVTFTTTDDAGLDNINVTATAVPEPTTLALLALGLAGIAGARRRYLA